MPIDVEMMIEAEAIRREHREYLSLVLDDYRGMGLLIASARHCDDGRIVNCVRWAPGATHHDEMKITRMYEGFVEPDIWKHHNWIH